VHPAASARTSTDGDVVGGGVGPSVAGPQQHRQWLPAAGRAVAYEAPQGMEPVAVRLEVGGACSLSLCALADNGSAAALRHRRVGR
jgi:hypothetical protein